MRGPPDKRNAPAAGRGARKADLAGKADRPEHIPEPPGWQEPPVDPRFLQSTLLVSRFGVPAALAEHVAELAWGAP